MRIVSAVDAFYVIYFDGQERKEVIFSAPSVEKAKEYLLNYVPAAKVISVIRA